MTAARDPAGAIEQPGLTLGFVPLTSAAPLAVAAEKGIFARHGLDVRLSREASWASVRDKVATGMLDAAQMLAPMPMPPSWAWGRWPSRCWPRSPST